MSTAAVDTSWFRRLQPAACEAPGRRLWHWLGGTRAAPAADQGEAAQAAGVWLGWDAWVSTTPGDLPDPGRVGAQEHTEPQAG